MEVYAKKDAVFGERVPLGLAVVILTLVVVALVPWMESAVQTVGGVVLFSFPLFKIILNQPEVCIYYLYKLLVLRSHHAKYRNKNVLSARKQD